MLFRSRHPFLQHDDLAKERAALESVYQQRAYAPLWLDANGELTAQAGAVLEALRSANELGLDAAVYEATTIAHAAAAARDDASSASVDLAVAVMAVRFATNLHFGRVDPATAGFYMPKRSAIDVPQLLARLSAAADPRAELARLEPPFEHYRLLKSALATYRGLAAQQRVLLPPLPAKEIGRAHV